ncbi:MAG: ComEC/Rec2 family competence protein [Planctomycetota bacterium]
MAHYGTRPSNFLRHWREVTRFFIANFDEDHVSDLPALRLSLHIGLLHRNDSITAQQLRHLKLQGGPISPAMASVLDMMQTYTGGPPALPPALSGVEFTSYWNNYGEFRDTNNLSVVTFLHVGNVDAIIPGDIETAGWLKLLERPAFRHELSRVRYFIASHHGRESGYCREVFDYATNVEHVIFSDSEKKYASQEMTSVYASHARGGNWDGTNIRKVLTTRNDGTLWFRV